MVDRLNALQVVHPGKQPVFLLFLAVLFFLPFAHGSYYEWAWGGFAAVIQVLLLVTVTRYLLGSQLPPVIPKARIVLVIWGLWLGWLLFQLLPIPPGLAALLSPMAAAMQSHTREGWLILTVDRHTSTINFLQSTAYVSLFLLALLLVTSRRHLYWLLICVVASGVFQAILGLFLVFNTTDTSASAGFPSGTFYNRNHFSGYMELTIALGIGLLVASTEGRTASSWRRQLSAFIEWVLSPRMLMRIAVMVMVIALVLGRSRMGNTAMFSSLLIVGTLYLFLSRRGSTGIRFLLASLVVIDIVIVGGFFGVDKVVERIRDTSAERELRDELARDNLAFFGDYWLTGSGGGTYGVSYPGYQYESAMNQVMHAHMDYLETAVETGVIGIGLLAAAVLLALAQAVETLRYRHDPLCRGAAFGVLMATCSLGIHSWVDHNLQIPATAGTLMVILALGWISRNLGAESGNETRLDDNRLRGGLAVIALALVWLTAVTLDFAHGAWHLYRANQSLGQVLAGKTTGTASLGQIRQNLETARFLRPRDADVLTGLANVHLLNASNAGTRAATDSSMREALELTSAAVKERPVSGRLWTDKVFFKHALSEYDPQFEVALDRSVALAGNQKDVQLLLLVIALSDWPSFTSESKQLLQAVLDNLAAQAPAEATALMEEGRQTAALCGELNKGAFTALCGELAERNGK